LPRECRGVGTLNPFRTDVEKSRAEIARLEAARERLHAQRANAEVELRSCLQAFPDAALASELDEPVVDAGKHGFNTPAAAIAANVASAELTIKRCGTALTATDDGKAITADCPLCGWSSTWTGDHGTEVIV